MSEDPGDFMAADVRGEIDAARHGFVAHGLGLERPEGVELDIVEPPCEGIDLNTWARADPLWARCVSATATVTDIAAGPNVAPGA